MSPEAFGARVGQKPLRVGVAAILKYLPGARWRPRTLSTGQAVLAVMEDTLSAQLDPEGAFRVLHKALDQALVIKTSRGEAEETAEQLIAALEGTQPAVRGESGRKTLHAS